MSEELLKKRKEDFIKKIQGKNFLIYIVMLIIAWFGYYIRTRNLQLLKDVTTGKYIPLALDPHVFLRYVRDLIQQGSLYAVDYMRNYPLGFPMEAEVPLVPKFIAYLYKFLHFFSQSLTIEKAHVLYPPICFAIGAIFFFLVIKRLFDIKAAVISTAFLAVVPPFLYRTMAGFSDKEAMATMFIFMTFYFFIRAWQENNLKKIIFFGVLAGVSNGLGAMSWGGIKFVYMILGIFGIICVILNKFSKKDFYAYTSWMIVLMIMLQFSRGGAGITGIKSFITSSTSGVVVVAFFMALTDFLIFKLDLFNVKNKIKKRMPSGFASFFISLIFILLLVMILIDPLFIINKAHQMTDDLLNPLPNRWVRTVAESHEPYIQDWFNQMSFNYVMLVIGGSVLLVYEMLRRLKKKYSIPLVISYAILILLFIFSRYSSNHPIFNGVTPTAKLAFLGSPLILIGGFIIFYLYSFYKEKEGSFNKLLKIKKENIFVLIWFIIMIMGARRAVRLIFIFAPVTTVLFGFLSTKLLDYSREKLKKDWMKIIAYVLIGIVVVSIFYGFAKSSMQQAQYTGPSYNQQWQRAGQWIRENTPKDAVFAHWWDYGYWVQTGGERATITDGGNAIGYWNYLMGRHVLTGQSDEEPIPFLYAHNATHLLIISDEIGKYPAFSSIGSDKNYDRYSWINTFFLDEKNIQELRNRMVYVYRGGTPLDDDFIFEEQLYPKQAAGIGGFLVSITKEGNRTGFGQPFAILVYNGRQAQVPLNCIFINGQEVTFQNENGLDGCLMIIPKIDGQQVNPIGAALWLSPKVKKGRIAQLYLFEKESKYFKKVYDDSDQMPLAFYNGRIIGPLKIWEISYPEKVEVPEEFYGTTFPDISVTYV